MAKKMAQVLFKACIILVYAGFLGTVAAAISGQWLAALLLTVLTAAMLVVPTYILYVAEEAGWKADDSLESKPVSKSISSRLPR